MSTLVSKVFCITSYDGIEDAFQKFALRGSADIVPSFQPAMLMDDDFIAGFCTKGDVTVLPLEASPAFDFSVEKSILTFKMSPIVYAGFGLACSKVKEKAKRLHYRFRLDLRVPKFRRNSRLHHRLRSFLSASTNPIDSIRVPPEVLKPKPCLVHWSPLPMSQSTPLPESFAAYLSNDDYCKLRPVLKIQQWSKPVHLPPLFPSDLAAEANIDPVCARLTYTILSGLVTGIIPPPSSTADSVTPNPCITEPRLAPFYSIDIREATEVGVAFEHPVLLQLTGLFTSVQIAELESAIRAIVMQQSGQRGFLFFATRPFSSNQSVSPCPPENRDPVAKLFISDPVRKPPLITLNFKVD